MAQLTRQPTPLDISPAIPAGLLARRLAAAGLGVQVSRRRDTCELTILGMPQPGSRSWRWIPAGRPAGTTNQPPGPQRARPP